MIGWVTIFRRFISVLSLDIYYAKVRNFWEKALLLPTKAPVS